MVSWRSARKALYGAFGLAAVVSLTSVVPSLFDSATQGEAIPGLLVDGAILAAVVAGFVIDGKPPSSASAAKSPAASAATLPDWSSDAGSSLKVKLQLGGAEPRVVPLGELQAKANQMVVVLGGPDAWVRECLKAARFSAELFRAPPRACTALSTQAPRYAVPAAPSHTPRARTDGRRCTTSCTRHRVGRHPRRASQSRLRALRLLQRLRQDCALGGRAIRRRAVR